MAKKKITEEKKETPWPLAGILNTLCAHPEILRRAAFPLSIFCYEFTVAKPLFIVAKLPSKLL
jgi:hypothetical protein